MVSPQNGFGFDMKDLDPHPSDSKRVAEQLLGRRVYRAQYRMMKVAVKIIKDAPPTGENWDDILQECKIMIRVQHRCVARLYGYHVDKDNTTYLIMELAERGSLYDILRNKSTYPSLRWSFRLNIALGIIAGLTCLHNLKPPIFHRDLKSPNILIRLDWNALIADFGIARMKSSSQTTTKGIGSPRWMSPEMVDDTKNSYDVTGAIDIFSFGMILYELLTREVPFAIEEIKLTDLQIATAIAKGRRPTIPDDEEKFPSIRDCPPDYLQLMKECWHQDPMERPSLQNIDSRLRMLFQGAETKEKTSVHETLEQVPNLDQNNAVTPLLTGPIENRIYLPIQIKCFLILIYLFFRIGLIIFWMVDKESWDPSLFFSILCCALLILSAILLFCWPQEYSKFTRERCLILTEFLGTTATWIGVFLAIMVYGHDCTYSHGCPNWVAVLTLFLALLLATVAVIYLMFDLMGMPILESEARRCNLRSFFFLFLRIGQFILCVTSFTSYQWFTDKTACGFQAINCGLLQYDSKVGVTAAALFSTTLFTSIFSFLYFWVSHSKWKMKCLKLSEVIGTACQFVGSLLICVYLPMKHGCTSLQLGLQGKLSLPTSSLLVFRLLYHLALYLRTEACRARNVY